MRCYHCNEEIGEPEGDEIEFAHRHLVGCDVLTVIVVNLRMSGSVLTFEDFRIFIADCRSKCGKSNPERQYSLIEKPARD